MSVRTSSEITPYNLNEKHNKQFDTNNWELPGDGIGLSISYMVANVYNYKHKVMTGREHNKIVNNISTYEPIYKWKDKLLYECIESSDKQRINPILKEKHNFLFSFNETHEMDYDESIIIYLENIIKSLKKMVDNVMYFFNENPDNITQKIFNQESLKLLN